MSMTDVAVEEDMRTGFFSCKRGGAAGALGGMVLLGLSACSAGADIPMTERSGVHDFRVRRLAGGLDPGFGSSVMGLLRDVSRGGLDLI